MGDFHHKMQQLICQLADKYRQTSNINISGIKSRHLSVFAVVFAHSIEAQR